MSSLGWKIRYRTTNVCIGSRATRTVQAVGQHHPVSIQLIKNHRYTTNRHHIVNNILRCMEGINSNRWHWEEDHLQELEMILQQLIKEELIIQHLVSLTPVELIINSHNYTLNQRELMAYQVHLVIQSAIMEELIPPICSWLTQTLISPCVTLRVSGRQA